MLNYIFLQEVDSTNSYMKRMIDVLEPGTVIYAYTQKAGRGQKGNSWEAETGKNITFSQLISKPRIAVNEQFLLSEAVSLAIIDVLEEFATGFAVKWPNDIYHGDRKIGGILIEHSLGNEGIEHTIVGVGVNINQRFFMSGAPNPVSLSTITGENHDVEQLTFRVCERIENYCNFDGSKEQLMALHSRYMSKLYRYDGKPHMFVSPEGNKFEAIIEDVALDGTLTLRHTVDNTQHHYHFKEVGFVINRVRFL